MFPHSLYDVVLQELQLVRHPAGPVLRRLRRRLHHAVDGLHVLLLAGRRGAAPAAVGGLGRRGVAVGHAVRRHLRKEGESAPKTLLRSLRAHDGADEVPAVWPRGCQGGVKRLKSRLR